MGSFSVDIDLLRTFLEVHRTRHFGRASHNLFITQSAISTRIKQLEEILGVRLFSRKRNDIQLTPAGQRFLKGAESLLSLWEETKRSVILDECSNPILTIGAQPSLWDSYLPVWVETMRRDFSQLAIRCETHGSEALIQGLRARTLDIGFMFEPPKIRELLVKEVKSVELVMVSTKQGVKAQEAVTEDYINYIMMDWGVAFSVEHSRWFPELPSPFLHLDRGRMAYNFLKKFGGATYLARTMVEKDLASGKLFLVEDAIPFKRMAYAVLAGKSDNLAVIDEALNYLNVT
ncbi:MAG: LysR family transcriptional regulator [Magnetococcales bacterium]|nr:LysR family transcriptional regulator [Magnetococcales bacterium]